MKHRTGWRKTLSMAAVVATLGVGPAILQGCSGSSNVLGPGVPTVNGNFTGAAANLGGGRTGNLQLQTFTDNSVEGTLTVTAPVQLLGKVKGPSANHAGHGGTPGHVHPPVSLPVGVYNITGTRSGTSVTGQAVYQGTPAATYDFTATLSTSSTAGTWSINGTLNGEPFTLNGAINVNVTPTGTNPGGGGNNSFALSSNSSNATASALNTPIAVSQVLITPGTNNRLLSATFAVATSATNLRNLSISILKSSGFAVGDTFTVGDTGPGSAVVLYGEGVPTNKAWQATSGTVRITAINGNNVTLKVESAVMAPTALAGPGQTNQATWQFTLNGSATVTATGL